MYGVYILTVMDLSHLIGGERQRLAKLYACYGQALERVGDPLGLAGRLESVGRTNVVRAVVEVQCRSFPQESSALSVD